MTSVVRVELCPARRAISSTGTPQWLITLTKEVRSSFGTHLSPMPAARQTVRKSRRTLWESGGAGACREHQIVLLPKRPGRLSLKGLLGAMLQEGIYDELRQLQRPPGLLGLHITLRPHRSPHGH